MFRGFYTVASGMLAQQRKTEMLSNNMAGANTPGFKADQASLRAFPAMLLNRIDQKTIPTESGLNLPVNNRVGALNTGVYMQEAIPKFIQGDPRETGLNTDLALIDINMPVNRENGQKGSVFFTVEGADGKPHYTRNGNFTLDGLGFLTTASGQYVLDDQGNRIQLSSENFKVNDTGLVTDETGARARIGIGYSDNPLELIKEGDGLYRTEDGTALNSAYNTEGIQFKTQQGFLEDSNVDINQTMTDMLSSYRAFEANQKVLQAYDRSMEKAANEIGKL
ncbi:flagellar hook-basal body protein [Cytobacillus sp. Hz8]|uniref:flagellar hook-basal body protein n=1 Tax=Cytobacillus sp. Hz8 TaxID=3347168 RepID=UPI0035D7723E